VRPNARTSIGASRSVQINEFRFRLSDDAKGDEAVAEDASSPRYPRQSTTRPRMDVVPSETITQLAAPSNPNTPRNFARSLRLRMTKSRMR
jgi:hypothetical protein